MREWDYMVCNQYRDNCNRCPLLMDREEHICPNNGKYDSRLHKWIRVVNADDEERESKEVPAEL